MTTEILSVTADNNHPGFYIVKSDSFYTGPVDALVISTSAGLYCAYDRSLTGCPHCQAVKAEQERARGLR